METKIIILLFLFMWMPTGYLYEYHDRYTNTRNLIWIEIIPEINNYVVQRIQPEFQDLNLSRSSVDRLILKSELFGVNK